MGAQTSGFIGGAHPLDILVDVQTGSANKQNPRTPIDLSGFVDLQRLMITAGGNLPQLMSLVVDQSLKLLPRASGAAIALREKDELVIRASSGSVSKHVGFRFDLRTNMVWNLVSVGTPFMCVETETDPRVDLAACRAMRVRSMMLVPIGLDGETIGILNIISDLPHAFDSEDLLAAELLAGPVTIGLDAEVRRTQAQAHWELDRRFRATFEQAAVGIAHVDQNGRFLRVNERFCSIVGHKRETLLGDDFQRITHPSDLESDLAHVSALIRGESDSYTMEKRYFRSDGAIQWTRLTVSIVRASDDGEPFFVAIVEDINAQKAAQQEVLEDSLTGLPNRRWLMSNLPRVLTDCAQGLYGVGVTFIDLDGFKGINDYFGHEIGDECLIQTAKHLQAEASRSATVVRLSGDEFVILTAQTSQEQLRYIGERAQFTIERLGIARSWPINASVGSVFVTAGLRANKADVMKMADGMMYAAKRSGGGRHIMTAFDPIADALVQIAIPQ